MKFKSVLKIVINLVSFYFGFFVIDFLAGKMLLDNFPIWIAIPTEILVIITLIGFNIYLWISGDGK